MTAGDCLRRIPGDWHPGGIPDNVRLDPTAFIETSYSFLLYRSEAAVGLSLGRGTSVYQSTMFDVGPLGQARVGDYAMLNGAWIMCDAEIDIGDYALISWNVVIMDSYRAPFDPLARRRRLERAAYGQSRRLLAEAPARPVRIGANVWLGFDVCVLPGVAIGEGAVVGARSVVIEDVPAYSVVAGNPARLIRHLNPTQP